jgi:hypothetical protein
MFDYCSFLVQSLCGHLVNSTPHRQVMLDVYISCNGYSYNRTSSPKLDGGNSDHTCSINNHQSIRRYISTDTGDLGIVNKKKESFIIHSAISRINGFLLKSFFSAYFQALALLLQQNSQNSCSLLLTCSSCSVSSRLVSQHLTNIIFYD